MFCPAGAKNRRRRRQSGYHGLCQYQAFNRLRIIARQGVRHPHADIMAHHRVMLVAQDLHQAVQAAGRGPGVITVLRFIGEPGARQIHRDRLESIRRQCLHHMPPGQPGLRPTGNQQYRHPLPLGHIMNAAAVDLGVAMLVRAPGERLLFEEIHAHARP